MKQKTLKQILEENIKDGQKWGPWHFRESSLVLELNFRRPGGSNDWYEIHLADCCSSAEVLDWIMQIADKSWASDEIIANLIRALKDCLHPQSNLCGSGIDKVLTF